MSIDIQRILRKDAAMLLAFDQGLEHGPRIFDRHTIDPAHILNIALEGDFTGVVLQPGIAEKYYHGAFRDIPLIIKLNGKSELGHLNPVSKQTCTVDRAVKLGADGVGYTIYDGSPAEPEQFAEFGRIVEDAHDYGIPVIAWMYPRGPGMEGHTEDSDVIAYAARIGLELGADFVKIKYNHDPEGFDWVVESAGRAKVLIADHEWANDADMLHHVHQVRQKGGAGIAFGRTIWQHPRPLSLSRALADILLHGKTPDEALEHLQR